MEMHLIFVATRLTAFYKYINDQICNCDHDHMHHAQHGLYAVFFRLIWTGMKCFAAALDCVNYYVHAHTVYTYTCLCPLAH